MCESAISNNLFDKKVICPICNSVFLQKCVKAKTPRVLSKDSDFFVRYKTINPYFYDVWVCRTCGYSALKADFEKVRDFEKELIWTNLTPFWTPINFASELSAKDAIIRYNLALKTTSVLKKKSSIKAPLLLRIAWMYRLLENENEKTFLVYAIEHFSAAYSTEEFPICGMQRDAYCFLVGELYRRIEDYDNALLWLSKVIENTNSTPIIKKYTYDARMQIKEIMSNTQV